MIALLLVLALLAIPGASALDALPSRSTLATLEARLLVRAAPGGALRVVTDAPALAGLAAPGGAPSGMMSTPATLAVPSDASWHGLPGTVEVVLRREAATQEMRIEVDDGESGVVFEWPAEARRVPMSPLALSALAAAGLLRRRPR